MLLHMIQVSVFCVCACAFFSVKTNYFNLRFVYVLHITIKYLSYLLVFVVVDDIVCIYDGTSIIIALS